MKTYPQNFVEYLKEKYPSHAYPDHINPKNLQLTNIQYNHQDLMDYLKYKQAYSETIESIQNAKQFDRLHERVMKQIKQHNEKLNGLSNELQNLKAMRASKEEMDVVIAKTLDTPEVIAEQKKYYELAQQRKDNAEIDDIFIQHDLVWLNKIDYVNNNAEPQVHIQPHHHYANNHDQHHGHHAGESHHHHDGCCVIL